MRRPRPVWGHGGGGTHPMLSRRWTVIVLAGWLLVTGWFLVRDVRPRLQVDEPAPFAVTIGDEPRLSLTGTQRARLTDLPWLVIRNGVDRNAGSVLSRIEYNQWSDTLEFHSEFKLRSTNPRRFGNPWVEVESTFRVDWEGALQDFDVEMRVRRESLLLLHRPLVGVLLGGWLPGLTEYVPEWPLLGRRPFPPQAADLLGVLAGAWLPGLHRLPDWPVTFTSELSSEPERRFTFEGETRSRVFGNLSGLGRPFVPPSLAAAMPALNLYLDTDFVARCRARVNDGRFLPQWRVTGEQRDPIWNPVALSRRGHVLLLFHPLNRLPGLKAGQRWVVPLIDPEAALNLDRTREVRNVLADVSEADAPPDTLSGRGRPQRLLVVRYLDGNREVGSTWVRPSDFFVLRQELTFSSDKYVLERMRELGN